MKDKVVDLVKDKASSPWAVEDFKQALEMAENGDVEAFAIAIVRNDRQCWVSLSNDQKSQPASLIGAIEIVKQRALDEMAMPALDE